MLRRWNNVAAKDHYPEKSCDAPENTSSVSWFYCKLSVFLFLLKELLEAVTGRCSVKRCFEKFRKIHKEICKSESLLIKLQAGTWDSGTGGFLRILQDF